MSSVKLEGMPNTKLHFDTKERICPICGKNFIPAPYHYWKIGYFASDETYNEASPGGCERLVCTYSCMRKWEKSHGRKK